MTLSSRGVSHAAQVFCVILFCPFGELMLRRLSLMQKVPTMAHCALSESLAICATVDDGLLKLGRRAPISLLERRTEMTVAGKAQVQRKLAQVVVLGKEVECARQPQA